jgi:hypothetical protein
VEVRPAGVGAKALTAAKEVTKIAVDFMVAKGLENENVFEFACCHQARPLVSVTEASRWNPKMDWRMAMSRRMHETS